MSAFEYPKAKYAIPDKYLGPYALRRDYEPGVLLLTDPVRGSFLVSCLQSQAPHTIFVAPNSPTSFLCESSFFQLNGKVVHYPVKCFCTERQTQKSLQ